MLESFDWDFSSFYLQKKQFKITYRGMSPIRGGRYFRGLPTSLHTLQAGKLKKVFKLKSDKEQF